MPFGIKDYHKSMTDIHVGCEKPRAYFVPYHSEESATFGHRDRSEYFKTLIGSWDFKFFNSVTEVPDVRVTDVLFSEKLDVPMNWQHAIYAYSAMRRRKKKPSACCNAPRWLLRLPNFLPV